MSTTLAWFSMRCGSQLWSSYLMPNALPTVTASSSLTHYLLKNLFVNFKSGLLYIFVLTPTSLTVINIWELGSFIYFLWIVCIIRMGDLMQKLQFIRIEYRNSFYIMYYNTCTVYIWNCLNFSKTSKSYLVISSYLT